MTLADLPAVLQIEATCYRSPWSEAQFRQELENPVARVELLTVAGELAGYLCYWLIAGEMQILNVATAPAWQRHGVASRLLQQAFRCCRDAGLQEAWLEVRKGNRAAIALYTKLGFVITAERQGYYRDGEDALLMVREFPA